MSCAQVAIEVNKTVQKHKTNISVSWRCSEPLEVRFVVRVAEVVSDLFSRTATTASRSHRSDIHVQVQSVIVTVGNRLLLQTNQTVSQILLRSLQLTTALRQTGTSQQADSRRTRADWGATKRHDSRIWTFFGLALALGFFGMKSSSESLPAAGAFFFLAAFLGASSSESHGSCARRRHAVLLGTNKHQLSKVNSKQKLFRNCNQQNFQETLRLACSYKTTDRCADEKEQNERGVFFALYLSSSIFSNRRKQTQKRNKCSKVWSHRLLCRSFLLRSCFLRFRLDVIIIRIVGYLPFRRRCCKRRKFFVIIVQDKSETTWRISRSQVSVRLAAHLCSEVAPHKHYCSKCTITQWHRTNVQAGVRSVPYLSPNSKPLIFPTHHTIITSTAEHQGTRKTNHQSTELKTHCKHNFVMCSETFLCLSIALRFWRRCFGWSIRGLTTVRKIFLVFFVAFVLWIKHWGFPLGFLGCKVKARSYESKFTWKPCLISTVWQRAVQALQVRTNVLSGKHCGCLYLSLSSVCSSQPKGNTQADVLSSDTLKTSQDTLKPLLTFNNLHVIRVGRKIVHVLFLWSWLVLFLGDSLSFVHSRQNWRLLVVCLPYPHTRQTIVQQRSQPKRPTSLLHVILWGENK